MPDETVVLTHEDRILVMQALAQRGAMALELRTGMRHSGGSLIARIRRAYGYRGSRRAVFEQFCRDRGLNPDPMQPGLPRESA